MVQYSMMKTGDMNGYDLVIIPVLLMIRKNKNNIKQDFSLLVWIFETLNLSLLGLLRFHVSWKVSRAFPLLFYCKTTYLFVLWAFPFLFPDLSVWCSCPSQ